MNRTTGSRDWGVALTVRPVDPVSLGTWIPIAAVRLRGDSAEAPDAPFPTCSVWRHATCLQLMKTNTVYHEAETFTRRLTII